MKLIDLYELLGNRLRGEQDADIKIAIKLPYATVGPIPMVGVKSTHMGIDWERGKFILYPEEDLTPANRDFAEQMRKMQERVGMLEYENRGLKAEIKWLKKKLKEEDV
jgi:hypothetical protein